MKSKQERRKRNTNIQHKVNMYKNDGEKVALYTTTNEAKTTNC